MRNVPERPYKCNQCPSSTFSTLSNLNKHLFSKHNTQLRNESAEHVLINSEPKFKNLNPQAPPNITISPTFPLSLPRNLSIIPQFGDPFRKVSGKSPLNSKSAPSTTSNTRVDLMNGVDRDSITDEATVFRKRSLSEEGEAIERKRTSPDLSKVSSQETHEPGKSYSEPLLVNCFVVAQQV